MEEVNGRKSLHLKNTGIDGRSNIKWNVQMWTLSVLFTLLILVKTLFSLDFG